MSDQRALKNPYLDYNGPESTQGLFDSQGRLTPAFANCINSKVKQLVAVMENGLKMADPSDGTGYTGWAGITLLYLRLHSVYGDPAFLQRALEYVSRSLRRSLTQRWVTFLCGDAGPLAVAAVIYYRLQRTQESEECINRLMQLHKSVVKGSDSLPNELLYGRVGFLFSLIFINQQFQQEKIPTQYIQQIDQDFTMMFGEDVSGRFLAKWPTYFKPRILAECRKLGSNEHFVDLLSAQENSNDSGWDGDLASILLLVHLLPPTYSRNSAKISAYQAAERVVKYLRIGANMENFLQSVAPGQPFLLCVGEKKSSIQKFFIIVDHRALPCKSQTSLGAFDELFKSHFIFSISYPHPLNSFYTFLQSTVYNIDVGSVKESPRVKELRARLLNSDL